MDVNHQVVKVPIIRIFLVILFFYHLQALACDEEVACPKCGEKSEFTWNPSNQYVTPKLSRFYELDNLINAAYQEGDFDKAKNLIQENLRLASIYRCNWNFGNAIHDSNRILGFIALNDSDVPKAANYLMEAGKSTGSPQLNSFGPNLDLANELLSKGEHEAVISYLTGVRKFWDGKESIIDVWIQNIRSGEMVELNQYQPELSEMIANAFSLTWPFILAFIFWYKIKPHLSNNWYFPILAVLSGFMAMILGGILIGPVVMALVGVVSEDLLVPLIIGLSILLQFGAPILAIYLVAGLFKNRPVPENS